MKAFEYGQKLAEADEDDTARRDTLLGAGAAATGAYGLAHAKPLVTGRTTLHHGTTEALKEEILRNGLKPSATVSSPSLTQKTVAPDIRRKAMDLVYMADSPLEARSYAGQAKFLANGGDVVKQPVERAMAGYGAALNPFHGGVATADVPLWRAELASKLRQNPEARGTFQEFKKHVPLAVELQPEAVQKAMWSQLNNNKAFADGLDAKWFRGSKTYQPLSLGEVTEYAKQHPGRFASGVGLSVAGVASLGYGAHKLYQAARQKATEEQNG